MAISPSATSATQSNPYQMLAASSSGQSTPGITLPSVSTTAVDPKNLPMNNQSVLNLLANVPQSLTATIGPLLQKVFGNEQNLMAPIFQQQGAQGAAQAQSDAARRGLTGSSIEASSIGQAYTAANQGYNQYLAQMLQQLVPQYTQAAQFDIGNQSNYYQNLAQAVGQGTAANTQMSQFQIAQANAARAASENAKATEIGGIAQGIGSALSAFCDIRLKEKVTRIGDWRGMGVYAYLYKHDKGIDLPHGVQVGVLAHEVAKNHPEALSVDRGYLKVNYKKLWEVA